MLARERLRLTAERPDSTEPDLSLREPILKLFKKLDERKSPLILKIQEQWKQLAGELIAGHSYPARLIDKILYVDVANSSWLNEIIRFHSASITRLLQKKFGAGVIRKVNYRVNPECCRRQNSD